MEKINTFLEFIKKSDLNSAYAILHEKSESDDFNQISNVLKTVLTSHFLQQRAGKMNALINLKKSGFSPSLVIDVGAQIGTPELFHVFPDAHHIFIEPVMECIPHLQHIASQLKSVDIHNCAISNINGKTEISLTPSRQYASIDHKIGDEVRTIDVKTIDSIVEELPLETTREILLKIDVDGPEIKVLQGSKSLLKSNCILLIEASIADEFPRFNKLIDYLSAYDYDVYDIVDPMYRQSDWHLWQVDIILAKRTSYIWGEKKFS